MDILLYRIDKMSDTLDKYRVNSLMDILLYRINKMSDMLDKSRVSS